MMVGLSAAGQPVPGYEKIAVAAERFAAQTPAGCRRRQAAPFAR